MPKKSNADPYLFAQKQENFQKSILSLRGKLDALAAVATQHQHPFSNASMPYAACNTSHDSSMHTNNNNNNMNMPYGTNNTGHVFANNHNNNSLNNSAQFTGPPSARFYRNSAAASPVLASQDAMHRYQQQQQQQQHAMMRGTAAASPILTSQDAMHRHQQQQQQHSMMRGTTAASPILTSQDAIQRHYALLRGRSTPDTSNMHTHYPQNNTTATNMRTPNQQYAAPQQEVYIRTEGAMRLEAQFAQYAQYNAQLQYPQHPDVFPQCEPDIIYPRDEDIIYPAREQHVHDEHAQTQTQYPDSSRQMLNFGSERERERANYPNVLQHQPISRNSRSSSNSIDMYIPESVGDHADSGVKRKSNSSDCLDAAADERRHRAVESRKAWLDEMVCVYVCVCVCEVAIELGS